MSRCVFVCVKGGERKDGYNLSFRDMVCHLQIPPSIHVDIYYVVPHIRPNQNLSLSRYN